MSAAATSTRALAMRPLRRRPATAALWRFMDSTVGSIATANSGRSVALSLGRPLSTSRPALARAKPPAADKPPILEKPEKFNPPSHGTRLPRKGHGTPSHYGGELPQAEVEAQAKREYPTMMAAKGTWAHWFWTNSTIHSVIAIGVLTTLGLTTFFLDFTHSSPYRDLLPPKSEFLEHPIEFVQQWCRVLYTAWAARGQRAREVAHARVNDGVKRRIYLKAHGIKSGAVEELFGDATTDEEAHKAMDEAEMRGTQVAITAREEAARKRGTGWFGS